MYGSWDPNWRGFVGTALIVALEEFGDLIPEPTTTVMLESLYNNTVGDSYRGGGINGDNLYPAYSNPVDSSPSLGINQYLSAYSSSPLCELLLPAGRVDD